MPKKVFVVGSCAVNYFCQNLRFLRKIGPFSWSLTFYSVTQTYDFKRNSTDTENFNGQIFILKEEILICFTFQQNFDQNDSTSLSFTATTARNAKRVYQGPSRQFGTICCKRRGGGPISLTHKQTQPSIRHCVTGTWDIEIKKSCLLIQLKLS